MHVPSFRKTLNVIFSHYAGKDNNSPDIALRILISKKKVFTMNIL